MSQVKNKFDKESLIKIFKGACIAGGGVAVLYLLEWLAQLDFGSWTPLATGVIAVLINAVREWHKGIKSE